MKKLILATTSILALAVIFTFVFNANADKGRESIEIGAKAPMSDRAMLGTDGNKLSLEDAKGENGLLVIFSCNTCPFVIYWEDRYPGLYEMCQENGIGMIVVNSNEAKREGDDSLEEMQQHAEENGYEFSYVIDENSKLANAFGAKTTPHVYLFDNSMELAYRGAIDDNYRDKDAVENHYLSDAMNNMRAGKKIEPNSTKPIGCSIKRVKL